MASQIIISDGGSTDNTISIAQKTIAKVLFCSAKGRGKQMNFGASVSTNNILYFLSLLRSGPKAAGSNPFIPAKKDKVALQNGNHLPPYLSLLLHP